MLHELLSTFGLGEERLWLRWIAASEGNMFAETVAEMTTHLRDLGPSPLKLKKIA
jgi:coenzyme F420-reducing hydrogenase delta subunit